MITNIDIIKRSSGSISTGPGARFLHRYERAYGAFTAYLLQAVEQGLPRPEAATLALIAVTLIQDLQPDDELILRQHVRQELGEALPLLDPVPSWTFREFEGRYGRLVISPESIAAYRATS